MLMIANLETSVNKEHKSQGIINQSQRFFFNASCMYFRLQLCFLFSRGINMFLSIYTYKHTQHIKRLVEEVWCCVI